MAEPNQTVTHFVFLGLTDNRSLELFLFLIFFIIYLLTLVGNLLIVVTVACDRCLHTPMYFLLGNLSFLDICHSSVTAPKMLLDSVFRQKIISFGGCVAQFFFLHICASAEIFLLTIMAYDRCVAICYPLQYVTLVNLKICVCLVGALWIGGIIHSLVQTVLTLRLPFCGPNVIDSFFCDIPPVMKLACADTYFTEVLMISNSGVISLLCFLALVSSYAIIFLSLRKQTAEGRRKAFSTCAAHLLVVILFLGPCIFIYTRPTSSFSTEKMAAVFYTMVTPFLNPLIYTLRNKEVKNSLRKLWFRRKVFFISKGVGQLALVENNSVKKEKTIQCNEGSQ
ncbi:olfactory receptor 1509-like [Crotalus tigris]|uniref:olfactory receptor 1509-like n=2 Tax=Crotalus tigris TaxID=88082 RepID=UPI00192F3057|nr:olfactory receptor 1509-like [Crotalus tigris]XP_039185830.1 olfactory receptor 1509-like [Crotalus tigris]